jgi:hypothetical protein
MVFDLWCRLGKPDWDIDEQQADLVATASQNAIQGSVAGRVQIPLWCSV